jgi:hypothetical protein
MVVRGKAAHGAGVLLAACAALFQACAPPGDDAPEPPIVVMQLDSAEARFGAVDIAPFGERTLDALRDGAIPEDAWPEVLTVLTGDTATVTDTMPGVLGTWSVTDSGIRFMPRFPPVAGQTYTVRFDSKALRRFVRASRDYPALIAQFTVPHDTTSPRTIVRTVYPSTDSVPMNLLRLYIEFSAPMSVAESRRRVRLVDERGAVVPDALLNIAGNQELWDDARQRLTVFLDPGRIKRDLAPNEALGLPLQQGRRYRLVVDSAWKDATGKPLVRGFVKSFRVGPVDRGLPRVETWRVEAPTAVTREPLVVVFPEPMDHALASRMLTVRRRDGSVVDGTVSLTDRETRWSFEPRALWGTGAHSIEVDTELEDLAGNSLQKLFDVAPTDTGARGAATPTVTIPFVPRR